MSDEAAPKKRRVTRACDVCRSKRIKCGGEQPVCGGCIRSKDVCTYSRQAQKRGPPPGSVRQLSEKLRATECLLGHLFLAFPHIVEASEVLLQLKPGPSALSLVLETNSDATDASEDARHKAYEDTLIARHLAALAPEPSKSNTKVKLDSPLDGESPTQLMPPIVQSSAAPLEPNFDLFDVSPLQSDVPNGFLPPVPAMPNFSDLLLARSSGAAQAGTSLQQQYSAPQSSPSHHRRVSSVSSGVPTLLDLSSKAIEFGPTSSTHFFARHGVSCRPPERTEAAYSSASPSDFNLPSQLVNTALDLYFNFLVHPMFPMLDKNAVLRWAQSLSHWNGFQQGSITSAETMSEELVYALMALTVPYLRGERGVAAEQDLSARSLAETARSKISRASHAPTLATCQAALLLVLVDWSAADFAAASVSLATGVGLAFTLGLHKPPKPEWGANAQLYERTFYTAIILDALLAAVVGRPTMIKESDYSVVVRDNTYGAEEWELWRPMPSEPLRVAHSITTASGDALSPYRHLSLHARTDAAHSQPGVVRSCALSCFIELVKLCQVGAKIVNALNGSIASPNLTTQLRELEQWTHLLPAHLSLARAYGLGGTDDQALPPTHVWNLHLLQQTLTLLCIRPQDPKTFSEQAYRSASGASSILATCHSALRCYRALPFLEYVAITIAAALVSLPPAMPLTVEIRNRFSAAFTTLDELSFTLPALSYSLNALCELPEMQPTTPISSTLSTFPSGPRYDFSKSVSFTPAQPLPVQPVQFSGLRTPVAQQQTFDTMSLDTAFTEDLSANFLDADFDFSAFGTTEAWDPKSWVHGDILSQLGLLSRPASPVPGQNGVQTA